MKEKIYVFGHQKPDTDSVTSAISVAYLKQQLGFNAEARILGEPNKETKFVLDYFKVKTPAYLDSVRLQIKDVDYYKNYHVLENDTILETYYYFKENKITGAPVIDKDNKIKGVITSKDITRELIENDEEYIETSYTNLIRILKGEEILKFKDEIKGEVLVAAGDNDIILDKYMFENDTVLIVGNRKNIIKHAIDHSVNTIIIVDDNDISDEYVTLALKNKVNIIKTKYNSIKTTRKVLHSEYVKDLMSYKSFYKFNEDCNFYEFLKEANKLGHNNYPVVNRDDECLGLIRVTDKNEKHNKKVILVDHNESAQSVDGLNEAYIMEVVDHHKIGDLSTSDPINFRNMSVGSTNTIVYQMYKEQNIKIPYHIAGMMISGILSDTLALTSSTTTELDRITVNELSKLMKIDYNEYYREMLKAGTSIEGLTKLEVLTQDYKNFQTGDKKYAVGQTITLDIDNIMKDKDEYLKIMEDRKKSNDLELIVFIITDVLKNGSYLLYTSGCEEMFEESFGIKDVHEGMFVSNMTSRKKQVIPYINEYIK